MRGLVMSTAVFHNVELTGNHGSANYVLTIWDRNAMKLATQVGTAQSLVPLFEETVNNRYQPKFLLFPCPEELYINFTEVQGKVMRGHQSHSYNIQQGQEGVGLIFNRDSYGASIENVRERGQAVVWG